MHEKPNNYQNQNPKPEHKNFRIKLPELTYKTQWRLFAGYQIFLALTIGAINAIGLESDSKIRNILSILAISAMSFVASDGIVDLVKGTHHFVGLKTHRLISNKKGKEEIDEAIRNEMYARDKKPSDFKTDKN